MEDSHAPPTLAPKIAPERPKQAYFTHPQPLGERETRPTTHLLSCIRPCSRLELRFGIPKGLLAYGLYWQEFPLVGLKKWTTGKVIVLTQALTFKILLKTQFVA